MMGRRRPSGSLRMMTDEGRLIYEFDVQRAYGMN
jgi:hypothetical protein